MSGRHSQPRTSDLRLVGSGMSKIRPPRPNTVPVPLFAPPPPPKHGVCPHIWAPYQTKTAKLHSGEIFVLGPWFREVNWNRRCPPPEDRGLARVRARRMTVRLENLVLERFNHCCQPHRPRGRQDCPGQHSAMRRHSCSQRGCPERSVRLRLRHAELLSWRVCAAIADCWIIRDFCP